MTYHLYRGHLYCEHQVGRRQALEGEQPGADIGKVWPVYPSEAAREREEIENVFGLGGGELETEPWEGAFQYWYQDPPEWAGYDEADKFPDQPETPEGREGREDQGYEYRTGIVIGGGFLPRPNKNITDVEGIEWELVKVYVHSGESGCWVCGAGTDAFPNGFYEQYGREPGPGDQCGLCETKFEDMPGYVYVNDSYEAVYRTVVNY